MKLFVRILLSFIMGLWSHIYTYGRSQWFKLKETKLDTILFRNFIGKMGEKYYKGKVGRTLRCVRLSKY